MAEKLSDMAQLLQLRIMHQLPDFFWRKGAGIKLFPELIPHFINDD
ncbi:hypothetical protein [Akkermansia sp.]|nr:hypothetical protein [uncultured Akkermansia sp.]